MTKPFLGFAIHPLFSKTLLAISLILSICCFCEAQSSENDATVLVTLRLTDFCFYWEKYTLYLERMEDLLRSGGDSATDHLFDNDHFNHQQPNSNEFDSFALGIGDNGEPSNRRRLVWTPQLHKRFVDVVAHLGIKSVVPKTIMQLMSVDGLTRENVASHLQNYRLYDKNAGFVGFKW